MLLWSIKEQSKSKTVDVQHKNFKEEALGGKKGGIAQPSCTTQSVHALTFDP